MTARRETTTLLRLRSSLMTLNSSSLPSKCEVSFIGRRSTSEPGRKARMPFTMTVRPPFTLPETTPEMILPPSSAASSSDQAASFLAFSRDSLVAPKPSSSASMATETKSPGLTSISPRSFLNSSVEIALSDFSPAFTITTFWSTEMTSAVITSPERISWRVRLSSKRAAKLSVAGVGLGWIGTAWEENLYFRSARPCGRGWLAKRQSGGERSPGRGRGRAAGTHLTD